MAMGKRRRHARQKTMWVASTDLPQSAGHPFYERLNRVLDDASFDAFVEVQCAKFYTDGVGRPSVAPGRYFRLLLLGYFEGLDSERAIAWRAADSLSIRQFLDFELHEPPPDHSTVSRTRRLIAALVHDSKLTVNDPNPEASHRPILYDSGRPSSVIWFRTLHATTDSATRPPRDRARSRSLRIDLYRKNAFSTRAWSG